MFSVQRSEFSAEWWGAVGAKRSPSNRGVKPLTARIWPDCKQALPFVSFVLFVVSPPYPPWFIPGCLIVTWASLQEVIPNSSFLIPNWRPRRLSWNPVGILYLLPILTQHALRDTGLWSGTALQFIPARSVSIAEGAFPTRLFVGERHASPTFLSPNSSKNGLPDFSIFFPLCG